MVGLVWWDWYDWIWNFIVGVEMMGLCGMVMGGTLFLGGGYGSTV